MSSPMTRPALHDRLVLLDGGKRWEVPGVSRVKASLAANTDSQQTPGDGDAVVQLNEGSGEVDVEVTMWTAAQWDQYQHLLAHLRRGTKEGPAVFTSAHPEIRGRRISRLYFVSESADAYSPKTGYKATLKFSEKLKEKAKAETLGDDVIVVPGQPTAGGGTSTATTEKGQAMQKAALGTLVTPPAPADGGRATTATPGYCSASVRVMGTQAGLDPALFGASAKATEANFARANLSVPWNADAQRNLQDGDVVFWGNDPSGFGHVGVVVGRDQDGMPLIAGNNLVTYRQKGGRFDSGGRPIDRHIDSRGIVRMDQLSSASSQPTSIGKPGGVSSGPKIQGPAAPLPAARPSANVAGPG